MTAALAVITIVLVATGKIALYINPDSAWFAVGMAVVALVACIGSFAIKLGDEQDHGHDSDGSAEHEYKPRPVAAIATGIGGMIAVVVTGAALILPPASLSAQTAMDRDIGVTPLFGGDDMISLATTGDTATFGVGDWSTVFATASDGRLYEGTDVTLTGFVTPEANDGGAQLTRLVVTHCVIDAQPASVPLGDLPEVPETGQWVNVTGTVVSDAAGNLSVKAESVEEIDEPADPYEY